MSELQTEKKKSERGVRASLQQDQINVGALVREKEKKCYVQDLWGKRYLFLHLGNVSQLLEIHELCQSQQSLKVT